MENSFGYCKVYLEGWMSIILILKLHEVSWTIVELVRVDGLHPDGCYVFMLFAAVSLGLLMDR